MILFILSSILIGILIVREYWLNKSFYKHAAAFHGPKTFPIIGNGNIVLFVKNEEMLDLLYNLVNHNRRKDGSPFRIWFGPKLLIFFYNIQQVEKILMSQKFDHKHDIYDFIKSYLGEGLVSASGPIYRSHRKLILPLVNLQYVTFQYDVFLKNISVCLNKFEHYVGKENFNVYTVLNKCCVDIVTESILGTEFNTQEKGNNSFVQASEDLYNFGITRLYKPWLYPNIIYNNLPRKKTENRLVGTLQTYLENICNQSRQRVREHFPEKNKAPLIDQIAGIISNNPELMSQEDFRSHAATLFLASEDTLSINSSFALLCFGMYAEYQDKAAEEIREVFGTTPKEVKLNDIHKLEYLDQCIKDVLRLVPIGPYILRKVTEDVKIDDWVVPKDAGVVIPIFNIHRDPQYWENPFHFHPDHFLPEVEKKRPPFAYLPFSAGGRGCIGKIFAKNGLKLFLASFLQKYEVIADGKFPDLKLRMDISVRPLHGYNARIVRRVWK